MPDVEMWWFQIPLKLFSSASSDSDWLQCWEEGKQWMRPQEENSIKINRYKCDRFKELFKKISVVEWSEKRVAWVAGVTVSSRTTPISLAASVVSMIAS